MAQSHADADGPQADESATAPNPFTDFRMTVTFAHESGNPTYACLDTLQATATLQRVADVRQQMARAPGAGQGGQMEVSCLSCRARASH